LADLILPIHRADMCELWHIGLSGTPPFPYSGHFLDHGRRTRPSETDQRLNPGCFDPSAHEGPPIALDLMVGHGFLISRNHFSFETSLKQI
jgi:hypothetical protein